MHLHLPKPLHGWREFIGEVGIIVLGVLIALGFEQVVEAVHWHYESDKALDAVGKEAASHYRSAVELETTAPCIDAQLQALEKPLLTQGGGPVATPVPTFSSTGKVFAAPTWHWNDDVWRSTESAGVAPHFDRQLRQQLGFYYSTIATLRDSDRETLLIGWRLRVLTEPMQLDSTTRGRFLEELEEARGHYQFMRTLGGQIMRFDKEHDWLPTREQLARVATSPTVVYCRAHHLPLGRLEARQAR
jgi:hypothetical protein